MRNFVISVLEYPNPNIKFIHKVNSNSVVSKVFLTNDLTETVMEEAINLGANVIVSYHPPLFKEFKRISQANWKDRLVAKALKNEVCVQYKLLCLKILQGG